MIHRKINLIPALLILFSFASCSTAKQAYTPENKFSQAQLQSDYKLFRKILEENHPSLYWYQTKDSLDYFFQVGYDKITDSMTETSFRTLLSYVTSKIHCGHTTVRPSKKFSRYYDTARSRQFPLSIKFWDDTAVVAANLNRRDSILSRGTVLKKINGKDLSFYRDSLFEFLSMDGYGINHKYQSLSNRGNFGGWYKNVFGLDEKFSINYLKASGEEASVTIPIYDPRKDSLMRRQLASFDRMSKKERKRNIAFNNRNIQIDTTLSTAYLTVNTFTGGNHLRHFFKTSFKALRHHDIKNLVIDVRSNGGGNVGNSTSLTSYLIKHKFKLADSLYAINKSSHYRKYIKNYLQNKLIMTFISRKRKDGKYHFGYFERHYFKPKRKYHYDNKVYVLIGGNSFSATTLFASCIKNQDNVVLVGEETGGGAYGNTAWLIPDAVLPITGLRFRLPKFRMVMNRELPKNGRGVMPDIEVKPTTQSIKQGVDLKAEKIKELIRASTLKTS